MDILANYTKAKKKKKEEIFIAAASLYSTAHTHIDNKTFKTNRNSGILLHYFFFSCFSLADDFIQKNTYTAQRLLSIRIGFG